MISLCGCNKELPERNEISRSDLRFLKLGMSYDEVTTHIGEPDRDTGSGIYWFEYDLEGGERLLLGFANLNHLDTAIIVEKDGKQVNILP